MSSIRLIRVSKAFDALAAVDDLSLDVRERTLTVLLGPSGCGKSTCLRLIAGLETPDSGQVEIGGKDVSRLDPSRRGIAMVFQSYALFPHLSVADNIVFGLQVRGVPANERANRLARVAELVGLTSTLGRKPAQLSGGQRQRVALARAVIAEQPVCLMDEPLSNLDAKLRHEMRLEIRALQKKLGMTMVYVTHDQVEAMTMADDIVLMNGGRIEQTGSPEALYAQPATEFAARFIGQPAMNILKLVRDGGAFSRGIRPEHVSIEPLDAPGHAPERGVAATIESIEYLGADSVLLLAGEGNRVSARVNGVYGGSIGASVLATWRPEHEHRFDTGTGRRIAISQ